MLELDLAADWEQVVRTVRRDNSKPPLT